MKHSKLVALILSVCLVLGMIPMFAGAETLSNNDFVYFGNEGQKWLIADNAEMILLASDVVAQIAYNESGIDNSWDNSNAKNWCANYEASKLTAQEQGVLENGVSFLSKTQAEALEQDVLKASTNWWLSTPYAADAMFAYAVSDAGIIGYPHVAKNYGARPAIDLDESKIVMISALAKNNELEMVAPNTTGEWKLTVQNDAYSGFAVSSIVLNGRTVSVSFSGAATGENEQVSAYIKNTAGDVLAYGSISKGAAEATVNFELPQGVKGNLTIGVFNEQVNGGTATDYASAAVEQAVVAEDGYGYVKGWSLTLNGAVSANFVMVINTTDDGAVVKVTTGGTTKNIPVSEVKANNNVVNVDMAAAQMNDTIAIQVVDSNGNGGAVQEYTIRGYADYILNNSDDEAAKKLVKTMLNYGAKAQLYFGYNANNLANAGIDGITEVAVPTSGTSLNVSGSADGIRFYGASLVYRNKIAVRFYFTAESLDGINFQYPVVEKDGLYYVEVADINPQDLGTGVSVAVSDTSNTLTVTYAPTDYIIRMYNKADSSASLKALVQALYTYYCAAVEYTA